MKLLISSSEKQQDKSEKSQPSEQKKNKKYLKWLCKPKTFYFLVQIGLAIFRIVKFVKFIVRLGCD